MLRSRITRMGAVGDSQRTLFDRGVMGFAHRRRWNESPFREWSIESGLRLDVVLEHRTCKRADRFATQYLVCYMSLRGRTCPRRLWVRVAHC